MVPGDTIVMGPEGGDDDFPTAAMAGMAAPTLPPTTSAKLMRVTIRCRIGYLLFS
jgi:hypothetical protein